MTKDGYASDGGAGVSPVHLSVVLDRRDAYPTICYFSVTNRKNFRDASGITAIPHA